MSCETLVVYPDEVQFLEVRINQTYIQTVEIKNVLQSTCSFRIRPSNADRITVEPSSLSLAPGETKRVQVKLKLQGKALAKKKGGAAYRDTVQLKSDFFEKKFAVSFQPAGYYPLNPCLCNHSFSPLGNGILFVAAPDDRDSDVQYWQAARRNTR